MQVFVPFDAVDPKTRLDAVLDADERVAFARSMLFDVLDTLDIAGYEPTVLSSAPVECPAPVTVDERNLTTAVNAVLERIDPPIAVVMADLALVTPATLERLFSPMADVVLAPGLRGGTNAICSRHPDFRVDYHGLSYCDHLDAARALDADVFTVDSFRLACDIDEPPDLLEVLVHTDGHAAAWLEAAGFFVDADSSSPVDGLARQID